LYYIALACLGLPWIGFSSIAWMIAHQTQAFPMAPLLLVPGLGGALLFAGFVALAITDQWRFFGPLTD
jgi:hypothetical protein